MIRAGNPLGGKSQKLHRMRTGRVGLDTSGTAFRPVGLHVSPPSCSEEAFNRVEKAGGLLRVSPLSDTFRQPLGPVFPKETDDGGGQCRRIFGRDDEPGLFVRNAFCQPPHVGHHHGPLKVGGNLGDAALCGRDVRLHHEVGGAEVPDGM